MSGDPERTSVFIHDAVLRFLVWREDTIIDHALKNPIQLVREGWSLEYLRLRGAWTGGFRWHEAVCASEMHGSAAEICSPGAFGRVIKECEEVCFFGRRDEVIIDCQAWYGSLLRAQTCFIIVAAIFCYDWRFRGFMGLGNWYEELIDGFPFFHGWLHGPGKRCKRTSRGSVIARLCFHGGFRQAMLSHLKWESFGRNAGISAGGKHISPEDQPYVPALPYRLGTTGFSTSAFLLLFGSILLQSLFESVHELLHRSDMHVRSTAYGMIMVSW